MSLRETYNYNFPPQLGGLRTADLIPGEGYTVMKVEEGIITRTKLPATEAERVSALIEKGEFRRALGALEPVFIR
jgi:hypothetical protein